MNFVRNQSFSVIEIVCVANGGREGVEYGDQSLRGDEVSRFNEQYFSLIGLIM